MKINLPPAPSETQATKVKVAGGYIYVPTAEVLAKRQEMVSRGILIDLTK